MNTSNGQNDTPQTEEIQQIAEVSGRILLRENGRGISGLIVELNHVPDHNDPESQTTPADGVVRLGSTVTNDQGFFGIMLLSHEISTRNIQLRVLGPEGPQESQKNRLIYEALLRRNSGKQEHYLIRIPEASLEQADIPTTPPEAPEDEQAVKSIRRSFLQAAKIGKTVDDLFGLKLKKAQERRSLFRDKLLPELSKTLSTVSQEERTSGRYVDPASRVKDIYIAAVKQDVEALAGTGQPDGPKRLNTHLVLTKRQARALFPQDSNAPVTIDERELERKLKVTLDKTPVVYRLNLESDPCRPKTDAELCIRTPPDDQDPGDDEEDEDDDDGGVELLNEDMDTSPQSSADTLITGDGLRIEKGRLVARLMDRMASPEDPVVFGSDDDPISLPGSNARLRSSNVERAIGKLNLRPGPADVPAFYDFHDLQIAFEPVWQEALDDGYLRDIEAAYNRFVELGGEEALNQVKDIADDINTTNRSIFDSIFDLFSDLEEALDDSIPASVASAVLITLEEWQVLPKELHDELLSIASQIATLRQKLRDILNPDNYDIPDWIERLIDPEDLAKIAIERLVMAINSPQTLAARLQINLLTADAERIVAHARRIILEREASEPFKPNHSILDNLRQRLSHSYPFRTFAANSIERSVNFGVMVTYRQKWNPVSYQVGELVSTIPLGPREIRKFSKRTQVKKSRSRKEIESNLYSRRSESEEKSRAEAEIVARAISKTNFSESVEGSIKIGEIIGGSATSSFTQDAEKHSESVKKEFREAIFKSAQEYKNERKIEVSTEEVFEEEITESGELQNPNDEIPVTFLFYELQRRFRVSEKIHRLQSVVLVAQEVPSPASIDEGWLIEHDWILNRVLLDASFLPALTYVSTTLVSENVALKEMRDALFRHRKLVEELKEEVSDRRVLAGMRYAALQRQIERTAQSADSGGPFGFFGDVLSSIPGTGLVTGALNMLAGQGDEGASEANLIREGAARDAFDRERREEEAFATRLQQAISTLEALQQQYTERLSAHLRELVQVERLKLHIRQNILLYMQAIWSYEPDDQRYLRLRNIPVPIFQKRKTLRSYEIRPLSKAALAGRFSPANEIFEAEVNVGIAPPQVIETRPLSEVADLDRPLGFKGNYMIFPLVESNPITEFMMDPYVTVGAADYGLLDPDPMGNMTLEEFSEYVCCLRDKLPAPNGDGGNDDVEDPDFFNNMKPGLREMLKRLLESPLRDNEEIIVPTDSLYIEALPGAHPILEDFKLLHRAIDVKKVQAEVREMELENVRRAERILQDQLEDPEIEAKYVFEGGGSATVVPPDGSGTRGGL